MFQTLTPAEQTILKLFTEDPTRKVYHPDLPLTGQAYSQALTQLKRKGYLQSTRLPLSLTQKAKRLLSSKSKAEHSDPTPPA